MPFLNRSRSNNDRQDGKREKFLRDFCDTCLQPTGLEGCGSTFRSILEPISCPAELVETHIICPFCLDLRPRSQYHDEHCIFAQRGLQLQAGGWSTPFSNNILRSIRQSTFRYRNPLINLIRILLLELNIEDATIVPVPVESAGRTDRWIEMLQASCMNIPRISVIPLFVRKKLQSTRKNVTQIRERIVQQEYEVDIGLIGSVRDRRIILLDDNVTTGKTMTHCTSLLQQLGPRDIIPLTIERHVSVRTLQRCTSLGVETCPFYVYKDRSL